MLPEIDKLYTKEILKEAKDIFAFDFDDCMYHWYASELAIPFYYSIPYQKDTTEQIEFAKKFFSVFLKGYRQECEISKEWLSLLPEFLKHRDIIMYLVYYQIRDKEKWAKELPDYMKKRKERIEQNMPILDIDFTKF